VSFASYVISHENTDDESLCDFVATARRSGIRCVEVDLAAGIGASELDPRHVRAAVVLDALLTHEGIEVALEASRSEALGELARRVGEARRELAARGAAPAPRVAPAPAPPALADAFERARRAIAEVGAQGHAALADVTPPPLREEHLQNSRILPSREHILERLPRGGVAAEVGTQTGSFARKILDVLAPSALHLYDRDFTPFDRGLFRDELACGRVILHEGDSSKLLATLPDAFFDFVYVDGDHAYAGVRADLDQARRKVKPDGWIVCNDYTLYSPIEHIPYGVARAVNELCLEDGWEIAYLGLHPWGYHDVALRKRGRVSTLYESSTK
jgi:SAM-dependent methyltransferase